MPLDLTRPVINLITNGSTTANTSPDSPEFIDILQLVESAVAAEISLIQLREKKLPAKALFELTSRSVALTRGTTTRLLVNDRFDIALAAAADGVHLTSRSVGSHVVRRHCGDEFLIGVSTHTLADSKLAPHKGADFVLFGPVFDTESKRQFGPPQGTDKLREVADALKQFPVVAIGGVTNDNVRECFEVGAAGVAAITLLNDVNTLMKTADAIRMAYAG